MKDIIEESDVIAVTSSPNTQSTINFDVISKYVHAPLLGAMVQFEIPVRRSAGQEDKLVAIGQITSCEMRNRWHEDPALKGYIKIKGNLPELTGRGDIFSGKIQIVGVYAPIVTASGDIYYRKEKSPPLVGTGIPIKPVSRELIENIMSGQSGYGYLGYFTNAKGALAPVMVRHFGDFEDGGSAEGYMGGIFGPSGSGKSVVAANLISLWASNPQMGILILDPASEFSSNSFGRGSEFEFDFFRFLSKTSKGRFTPQKNCINLGDLQLEGVGMFVKTLQEQGFFRRIGISSQKMSDVSDCIETFLANLLRQKRWQPEMSWGQCSLIKVGVTEDDEEEEDMAESLSFMEALCHEASVAYAAKSREEYCEKFMQGFMKNINSLREIWDATASLFSEKDVSGRPKKKVLDIIRDSMLRGGIYIIDLNPEKIDLYGNNEMMKMYLVNFIVKKLREFAHKYYSSKASTNCLIVMDEAGRVIPQYADNETVRDICTQVSNSVKEMRKMRCGFLFITQTISEIVKDIYRNLHFRVYGVGLGVGADSEHFREKEGDEALELYRSLPDPRLSGVFSFMVAGTLLTLGSTGRPMFIQGFGSGEEAEKANSHLFSRHWETVSRQDAESALRDLGFF